MVLKVSGQSIVIFLVQKIDMLRHFSFLIPIFLQRNPSNPFEYFVEDKKKVTQQTKKEALSICLNDPASSLLHRKKTSFASYT